MKKPLIVLFILLCITAHAINIFAEDAGKDYSFLDDMTINELKELDSEIHKRIPYEDSSNDNDFVYHIGIANDHEPEVDETIPFDEPITVLDNDIIKVDITGKYAFEDDKNYTSELGYTVNVENKSPHYIEIFCKNARLDGSMLTENASPRANFDSIAPNSNVNGKLYIDLSLLDIIGEPSEDFDTLDELRNFESSIQVMFSDNGTDWGLLGAETYPLLCKVP